MKIESLDVVKFRHITNTKIEFGKQLTVITGQNGTGKSSLLGWVAQLCDYKLKFVRINGKPFKESYSNVFRFCPVNDFQNKYEVNFSYNVEQNIFSTKKITTRFVGKTEKYPERYRTDYDGRGSTLNFPIIYLGLKRLIPLATEDNIKVDDKIISSKDAKLFSNLQKRY